MDISFKTRQLYGDEQLLLQSLKAKMGKKRFGEINDYHFLIAMLLGIGFTYLAVIPGSAAIKLMAGVLASFAYGFIVVTCYLIHAERCDHETFLNGLNTFIDRGTVDTCLVNAKRIAVLRKAYNAESADNDYFIIECDSDKVLYLMDFGNECRTKFPCLDFEIYEPKFFRLIEKQFRPLSEPATPLILDESASWMYRWRSGKTEHLQVQNINFDKIVENFYNWG